MDDVGTGLERAIDELLDLMPAARAAARGPVRIRRPER